MTLKPLLKLTIITLFISSCDKPIVDPFEAEPWEKTYGGSMIDEMQSVLPTPDGGFIMAGYTTSNDLDVNGNKGGSDMWVAKLNSNHAIEWQKTLGGAMTEEAHAITLTPDGGYIIAGQTASTAGGDVASGTHGLTDMWVLKLNSTGNIVWQKTLGGTDYENANSVTVDAAGNCVVLGTTFSFDGDIVRDPNEQTAGEEDIWVVKLRGTDGSLLTQNTLSSSNRDLPVSIVATTNGYVIAGNNDYVDGAFEDPSGKVRTAFVLWLNSNLQFSSIRFVGNDLIATPGNTTTLKGMQGTADGGYIITGFCPSTRNVYIAKLTNNGNISWEKEYGGNGDDVGSTATQLPNGDFAVVGYSNSNASGDVTSFNKGYLDLLVFKIGSNGQLLGHRLIGGSGNDKAFCAFAQTDGSLIIGGVTGSNDGDVSVLRGGVPGRMDFWLMKVINL